MARTQLNPKIVEILSRKLNKGKSTITQQISLLKRKHPGLSSNAVSQIYAHDRGISVMQKLSNEEKNSLVNVNFNNTNLPTTRSSKGSTRTTNSFSHRTIQISKEFKFTDPILSNAKLDEAKEMASVYPLLYVLENSIRTFIDKVYQKNVGIDWWNTLTIKKELKEKVSKHKTNEEKNKWHQRRGESNLDYLDLIELKYFISFKPDFFIPHLLESHEWFNVFLQEVYMSRCVLCHMNPLEKTNIKALEVRFTQWFKIINAKIAHID